LDGNGRFQEAGRWRGLRDRAWEWAIRWPTTYDGAFPPRPSPSGRGRMVGRWLGWQRGLEDRMVVGPKRRRAAALQDASRRRMIASAGNEARLWMAAGCQPAIQPINNRRYGRAVGIGRAASCLIRARLFNMLNGSKNARQTCSTIQINAMP